MLDVDTRAGVGSMARADSMTIMANTDGYFAFQLISGQPHTPREKAKYKREGRLLEVLRTMKDGFRTLNEGRDLRGYLGDNFTDIDFQREIREDIANIRDVLERHESYCATTRRIVRVGTRYTRGIEMEPYTDTRPSLKEDAQRYPGDPTVAQIAPHMSILPCIVASGLLKITAGHINIAEWILMHAELTRRKLMEALETMTARASAYDNRTMTNVDDPSDVDDYAELRVITSIWENAESTYSEGRMQSAKVARGLNQMKSWIHNAHRVCEMRHHQRDSRAAKRRRDEDEATERKKTKDEQETYMLGDMAEDEQDKAVETRQQRRTTGRMLAVHAGTVPGTGIALLGVLAAQVDGASTYTSSETGAATYDIGLGIVIMCIVMGMATQHTNAPQSWIQWSITLCIMGIASVAGAPVTHEVVEATTNNTATVIMGAIIIVIALVGAVKHARDSQGGSSERDERAEKRATQARDFPEATEWARLEKKTWECLVCTLMNEGQHLSCVACGTLINENEYETDAESVETDAEQDDVMPSPDGDDAGVAMDMPSPTLSMDEACREYYMNNNVNIPNMINACHITTTIHILMSYEDIREKILSDNPTCEVISAIQATLVYLYKDERSKDDTWKYLQAIANTIWNEDKAQDVLENGYQIADTISEMLAKMGEEIRGEFRLTTLEEPGTPPTVSVIRTIHVTNVRNSERHRHSHIISVGHEGVNAAITSVSEKLLVEYERAKMSDIQHGEARTDDFAMLMPGTIKIRPWAQSTTDDTETVVFEHISHAILSANQNSGQHYLAYVPLPGTWHPPPLPATDTWSKLNDKSEESNTTCTREDAMAQGKHHEDAEANERLVVVMAYKQTTVINEFADMREAVRKQFPGATADMIRKIYNDIYNAPCCGTPHRTELQRVIAKIQLHKHDTSSDSSKHPDPDIVRGETGDTTDTDTEDAHYTDNEEGVGDTDNEEDVDAEADETPDQTDVRYIPFQEEDMDVMEQYASAPGVIVVRRGGPNPKQSDEPDCMSLGTLEEVTLSDMRQPGEWRRTNALNGSPIKAYQVIQFGKHHTFIHVELGDQLAMPDGVEGMACVDLSLGMAWAVPATELRQYWRCAVCAGASSELLIENPIALHMWQTIGEDVTKRGRPKPIDILTILAPPMLAAMSIMAIDAEKGELTWYRPEPKFAERHTGQRQETWVCFVWLLPKHAAGCMPASGQPYTVAAATTFAEQFQRTHGVFKQVSCNNYSIMCDSNVFATLLHPNMLSDDTWLAHVEFARDITWDYREWQAHLQGIMQGITLTGPSNNSHPACSKQTHCPQAASAHRTCTNYMRGDCRNGDTCKDSHSMAEVAGRHDVYMRVGIPIGKQEVCRVQEITKGMFFHPTSYFAFKKTSGQSFSAGMTAKMKKQGNILAEKDAILNVHQLVEDGFDELTIGREQRGTLPHGLVNGKTKNEIIGWDRSNTPGCLQWRDGEDRYQDGAAYYYFAHAQDCNLMNSAMGYYDRYIRDIVRGVKNPSVREEEEVAQSHAHGILSAVDLHGLTEYTKGIAKGINRCEKMIRYIEQQYHKVRLIGIVISMAEKYQIQYEDKRSRLNEEHIKASITDDLAEITSKLHDAVTTNDSGPQSLTAAMEIIDMQSWCKYAHAMLKIDIRTARFKATTMAGEARTAERKRNEAKRDEATEAQRQNRAAGRVSAGHTDTVRSVARRTGIAMLGVVTWQAQDTDAHTSNVMDGTDDKADEWTTAAIMACMFIAMAMMTLINIMTKKRWRTPEIGTIARACTAATTAVALQASRKEAAEVAIKRIMQPWRVESRDQLRQSLIKTAYQYQHSGARLANTLGLELRDARADIAATNRSVKALRSHSALIQQITRKARDNAANQHTTEIEALLLRQRDNDRLAATARIANDEAFQDQCNEHEDYVWDKAATRVRSNLRAMSRLKQEMLDVRQASEIDSMAMLREINDLKQALRGTSISWAPKLMHCDTAANRTATKAVTKCIRLARGATQHRMKTMYNEKLHAEETVALIDHAYSMHRTEAALRQQLSTEQLEYAKWMRRWARERLVYEKQAQPRRFKRLQAHMDLMMRQARAAKTTVAARHCKDMAQKTQLCQERANKARQDLQKSQAALLQVSGLAQSWRMECKDMARKIEAITLDLRESQTLTASLQATRTSPPERTVPDGSKKQHTTHVALTAAAILANALGADSAETNGKTGKAATVAMVITCIFVAIAMMAIVSRTVKRRHGTPVLWAPERTMPTGSARSTVSVMATTIAVMTSVMGVDSARIANVGISDITSSTNDWAVTVMTTCIAMAVITGVIMMGIIKKHKRSGIGPSVSNKRQAIESNIIVDSPYEQDMAPCAAQLWETLRTGEAKGDRQWRQRQASSHTIYQEIVALSWMASRDNTTKEGVVRKLIERGYVRSYGDSQIISQVQVMCEHTRLASRTLPSMAAGTQTCGIQMGPAPTATYMAAANALASSECELIAAQSGDDDISMLRLSQRLQMRQDMTIATLAENQVNANNSAEKHISIATNTYGCDLLIMCVIEIRASKPQGFKNMPKAEQMAHVIAAAIQLPLAQTQELLPRAQFIKGDKDSTTATAFAFACMLRSGDEFRRTWETSKYQRVSTHYRDHLGNRHVERCVAALVGKIGMQLRCTDFTRIYCTHTNELFVRSIVGEHYEVNTDQVQTPYTWLRIACDSTHQTLTSAMMQSVMDKGTCMVNGWDMYAIADETKAGNMGRTSKTIQCRAEATKNMRQVIQEHNSAGTAQTSPIELIKNIMACITKQQLGIDRTNQVAYRNAHSIVKQMYAGHRETKAVTSMFQSLMDSQQEIASIARTMRCSMLSLRMEIGNKRKEKYGMQWIVATIIRLPSDDTASDKELWVPTICLTHIINGMTRRQFNEVQVEQMILVNHLKCKTMLKAEGAAGARVVHTNLTNMQNAWYSHIDEQVVSRCRIMGVHSETDVTVALSDLTHRSIHVHAASNKERGQTQQVVAVNVPRSGILDVHQIGVFIIRIDATGTERMAYPKYIGPDGHTVAMIPGSKQYIEHLPVSEHIKDQLAVQPMLIRYNTQAARQEGQIAVRLTAYAVLTVWEVAAMGDVQMATNQWDNHAYTWNDQQLDELAVDFQMVDGYSKNDTQSQQQAQIAYALKDEENGTPVYVSFHETGAALHQLPWRRSQAFKKHIIVIASYDIPAGAAQWQNLEIRAIMAAVAKVASTTRSDSQRISALASAATSITLPSTGSDYKAKVTQIAAQMPDAVQKRIIGPKSVGVKCLDMGGNATRIKRSLIQSSSEAVMKDKQTAFILWSGGGDGDDIPISVIYAHKEWVLYDPVLGKYMRIEITRSSTRDNNTDVMAKILEVFDVVRACRIQQVHGGTHEDNLHTAERNAPKTICATPTWHERWRSMPITHRMSASGNISVMSAGDNVISNSEKPSVLSFQKWEIDTGCGQHSQSLINLQSDRRVTHHVVNLTANPLEIDYIIDGKVTTMFIPAWEKISMQLTGGQVDFQVHPTMSSDRICKPTWQRGRMEYGNIQLDIEQAAINVYDAEASKVIFISLLACTNDYATVKARLRTTPAVQASPERQIGAWSKAVVHKYVEAYMLSELAEDANNELTGVDGCIIATINNGRREVTGTPSVDVKVTMAAMISDTYRDGQRDVQCGDKVYREATCVTTSVSSGQLNINLVPTQVITIKRHTGEQHDDEEHCYADGEYTITYLDITYVQLLQLKVQQAHGSEKLEADWAQMAKLNNINSHASAMISIRQIPTDVSAIINALPADCQRQLRMAKAYDATFSAHINSIERDDTSQQVTMRITIPASVHRIMDEFMAQHVLGFPHQNNPCKWSWEHLPPVDGATIRDICTAIQRKRCGSSPGHGKSGAKDAADEYTASWYSTACTLMMVIDVPSLKIDATSIMRKAGEYIAQVQTAATKHTCYMSEASESTLGEREAYANDIKNAHKKPPSKPHVARNTASILKMIRQALTKSEVFEAVRKQLIIGVYSYEYHDSTTTRDSAMAVFIQGACKMLSNTTCNMSKTSSAHCPTLMAAICVALIKVNTMDMIRIVPALFEAIIMEYAGVEGGTMKMQIGVRIARGAVEVTLMHKTSTMSSDSTEVCEMAMVDSTTSQRLIAQDIHVKPVTWDVANIANGYHRSRTGIVPRISEVQAISMDKHLNEMYAHLMLVQLQNAMIVAIHENHDNMKRALNGLHDEFAEEAKQQISAAMIMETTRKDSLSAAIHTLTLKIIPHDEIDLFNKFITTIVEQRNDAPHLYWPDCTIMSGIKRLEATDHDEAGEHMLRVAVSVMQSFISAYTSENAGRWAKYLETVAARGAICEYRQGYLMLLLAGKIFEWAEQVHSVRGHIHYQKFAQTLKVAMESMASTMMLSHYTLDKQHHAQAGFVPMQRAPIGMMLEDQIRLTCADNEYAYAYVGNDHGEAVNEPCEETTYDDEQYTAREIHNERERLTRLHTRGGECYSRRNDQYPIFSEGQASKAMRKAAQSEIAAHLYIWVRGQGADNSQTYTQLDESFDAQTQGSDISKYIHDNHLKGMVISRRTSYKTRIERHITIVSMKNGCADMCVSAPDIRIATNKYATEMSSIGLSNIQQQPDVHNEMRMDGDRDTAERQQSEASSRQTTVKRKCVNISHIEKRTIDLRRQLTTLKANYSSNDTKDVRQGLIQAEITENKMQQAIATTRFQLLRRRMDSPREGEYAMVNEDSEQPKMARTEQYGIAPADHWIRICQRVQHRLHSRIHPETVTLLVTLDLVKKWFRIDDVEGRKDVICVHRVISESTRNIINAQMAEIGGSQTGMRVMQEGHSKPLTPAIRRAVLAATMENMPITMFSTTDPTRKRQDCKEKQENTKQRNVRIAVAKSSKANDRGAKRRKPGAGATKVSSGSNAKDAGGMGNVTSESTVADNNTGMPSSAEQMDASHGADTKSVNENCEESNDEERTDTAGTDEDSSEEDMIALTDQRNAPRRSSRNTNPVRFSEKGLEYYNSFRDNDVANDERKIMYTVKHRAKSTADVDFIMDIIEASTTIQAISLEGCEGYFIARHLRRLIGILKQSTNIIWAMNLGELHILTGRLAKYVIRKEDWLLLYEAIPHTRICCIFIEPPQLLKINGMSKTEFEKSMGANRNRLSKELACYSAAADPSNINIIREVQGMRMWWGPANASVNKAHMAELDDQGGVVQIEMQPLEPIQEGVKDAVMILASLPGRVNGPDREGNDVMIDDEEPQRRPSDTEDKNVAVLNRQYEAVKSLAAASFIRWGYGTWASLQCMNNVAPAWRDKDFAYIDGDPAKIIAIQSCGGQGGWGHQQQGDMIITDYHNQHMVGTPNASIAFSSDIFDMSTLMQICALLQHGRRPPPKTYAWLLGAFTETRRRREHHSDMAPEIQDTITELLIAIVDRQVTFNEMQRPRNSVMTIGGLIQLRECIQSMLRPRGTNERWTCRTTSDVTYYDDGFYKKSHTAPPNDWGSGVRTDVQRGQRIDRMPSVGRTTSKDWDAGYKKGARYLETMLVLLETHITTRNGVVPVSSEQAHGMDTRQRAEMMVKIAGNNQGDTNSAGGARTRQSSGTPRDGSRVTHTIKGYDMDWHPTDPTEAAKYNQHVRDNVTDGNGLIATCGELDYSAVKADPDSIWEAVNATHGGMTKITNLELEAVWIAMAEWLNDEEIGQRVSGDAKSIKRDPRTFQMVTMKDEHTIAYVDDSRRGQPMTLRQVLDKKWTIPVAAVGLSGYGDKLAVTTRLQKSILDLLQTMGFNTDIRDDVMHLAGIDMSGVGVHRPEIYIKLGATEEKMYWTMRHAEWGGTRGYNVQLASWSAEEDTIAKTGVAQEQPTDHGEASKDDIAGDITTSGSDAPHKQGRGASATNVNDSVQPSQEQGATETRTINLEMNDAVRREADTESLDNLQQSSKEFLQLAVESRKSPGQKSENAVRDAIQALTKAQAARKPSSMRSGFIRDTAPEDFENAIRSAGIPKTKMDTANTQHQCNEEYSYLGPIVDEIARLTNQHAAPNARMPQMGCAARSQQFGCMITAGRAAYHVGGDHMRLRSQQDSPAYKNAQGLDPLASARSFDAILSKLFAALGSDIICNAIQIVDTDGIEVCNLTEHAMVVATVNYSRAPQLCSHTKDTEIQHTDKDAGRTLLILYQSKDTPIENTAWWTVGSTVTDIRGGYITNFVGGLAHGLAPPIIVDARYPWYGFAVLIKADKREYNTSADSAQQNDKSRQRESSNSPGQPEPRSKKRRVLGTKVVEKSPAQTQSIEILASEARARLDAYVNGRAAYREAALGASAPQGSPAQTQPTGPLPEI